nr:MAG TPA: hypothetical protein [Microviridae sp.]
MPTVTSWPPKFGVPSTWSSIFISFWPRFLLVYFYQFLTLELQIRLIEISGFLEDDKNDA